MAYRYGNRKQIELLPASIEDYVAEDAAVRVYDAFVDALDFGKLGILEDPHQVGNSEYDPRAMVKLLVYGYSYGIKSSRKLERESHINLSFIWLLGGLKPDHKTIAEFRRRNRDSLAKVIRLCAELCLKLNLIDGNILFGDGTKFRANAGRGQSHDREYYQKALSELELRIGGLLEECEALDEAEQGWGSLVTVEKELAQADRLKAVIAGVLKASEESGKQVVNQTDPDCGLMRSIQGSHASYNVQSVVDDKHGLIVHAEAVNEATDVNQFARQVEQAQETLGKRCAVACADAGYADTEELGKIEAQGVKVIVPSQRQALHEPAKPFSKHEFGYDREPDCYYCPEGHRLKYEGRDKLTGRRHYRMEKAEHCLKCKHYGTCTSSKRGRKIIRLPNEELKEKLEARYEEVESQWIYSRRKTRCEHPFGHIKRNLKTDAFMLRGLSGVQAETSLLATCFNLARMITILGVKGLTEKLRMISWAAA